MKAGLPTGDYDPGPWQKIMISLDVLIYPLLET
jgi:hypothetical protein